MHACFSRPAAEISAPLIPITTSISPPGFVKVGEKIQSASLLKSDVYILPAGSGKTSRKVLGTMPHVLGKHFCQWSWFAKGPTKDTPPSSLTKKTGRREPLKPRPTLARGPSKAT